MKDSVLEFRMKSAYVGWKSFDEDGDEEVEQDVVSERHQRDEVERRPGGRAGHPVVQDLVPVFLSQNLHRRAEATNSFSCSEIFQNAATWRIWRHNLRAIIIIIAPPSILKVARR